MKNNKKGQGMVEYGLIIGLVAIVLVGALVALNGGLGNIFKDITGVLEDPAAATPNP
ncbi:MAG TPA: Flp family type IVb pilin [Ruminiclostridium sp.]|jgi:pilus assembly protein Flp/PilA|nr:Flp family type IVb pilin [Ruminiclostridium sp.]